jgi:hypothetical protein
MLPQRLWTANHLHANQALAALRQSALQRARDQQPASM